MKNTNKSIYIVPQVQLEIFTSMDVISTSFAGDAEGGANLTLVTNGGSGWSRRWGNPERSI